MYNNELFIYRQNNRERIDKHFVITKTSRVFQSIEIDRCEIYNQNKELKKFFVARKFNSKKILIKQTMIKIFNRH